MSSRCSTCSCNIAARIIPSRASPFKGGHASLGMGGKGGTRCTSARTAALLYVLCCRTCKTQLKFAGHSRSPGSVLFICCAADLFRGCLAALLLLNRTGWPCRLTTVAAGRDRTCVCFVVAHRPTANDGDGDLNQPPAESCSGAHVVNLGAHTQQGRRLAAGCECSRRSTAPACGPL